tara:strand:- start:771 stop:1079 length:309 start_codon:yes stop_codon:yes gene_type:complete
MECSLDDNPFKKSYIVTSVPTLSRELGEWIIDWTESTVGFHVESIETKREQIAENHWKVETGTELTISFNSCHNNYQEDEIFINGAVHGYNLSQKRLLQLFK